MTKIENYIYELVLVKIRETEEIKMLEGMLPKIEEEIKAKKKEIYEAKKESTRIEYKREKLKEELNKLNQMITMIRGRPKRVARDKKENEEEKDVGDNQENVDN